MHFMTAELLFGLWALLFAYFQSPCIKAMRDYVPIGNPYTKPFHNRGVMLTAAIALLIGAVYYIAGGGWLSLLLLPSFFALYKIIFDGIIGMGVYSNFFYVGTTSVQDRWMVSRLGKNAGRVKVIISSIILAVVNIVAITVKI